MTLYNWLLNSEAWKTAEEWRSMLNQPTAADISALDEARQRIFENWNKELYDSLMWDRDQYKAS
jgi:hypothetical protein